MLFIFIDLKPYPTLLLNFLTANGIFEFDFIAPMMGIKPSFDKDSENFDTNEKLKNHPVFITTLFYENLFNYAVIIIFYLLGLLLFSL